MKNSFDFMGLSLKALPEFVKFISATAGLSGLSGAHALVLLTLSEYGSEPLPFLPDSSGALTELEKRGLIRRQDKNCTVTAKGAIIVKALCGARDKFNRKLASEYFGDT